MKMASPNPMKNVKKFTGKGTGGVFAGNNAFGPHFLNWKKQTAGSRRKCGDFSLPSARDEIELDHIHKAPVGQAKERDHR